MTTTTLVAGDLSNPVSLSGGNDGSVIIQSGLAGAKVNALTIDTAGRVAMPSNVVAFSANRSSSQAISLGADTPVLFDTKLFDTTTAYAAATGRFNPQVAGYYQINCQLEISVSGMTIGSGSIRKNGAIWIIFGTLSVAFTALPYRITGSSLVYLNGSTDYIDITAFGNGSSGPTCLGMFSGILIAKA